MMQQIYTNFLIDKEYYIFFNKTLLLYGLLDESIVNENFVCQWSNGSEFEK